MVNVQSKFVASSKRCGGSIIDPDTILTAAHCVQDFDKKTKRVEKALETFVYAGKHDLSGKETHEQLRKAKVSLTAGYQPDAYSLNDIALLKLDLPLKFSEKVRPICLPKKNKDLSEKTKPTLIGWGHDHRQKGLNILQEIELRVVNEKKCKKGLPLYAKHKFICTAFQGGAGGFGACFGDSGGPLMVEETGRWYQYGVTSLSGLCNVSSSMSGYEYSFFTRVSDYKQWIDSQSKPRSFIKIGTSGSDCVSNEYDDNVDD